MECWEKCGYHACEPAGLLRAIGTWSQCTLFHNEMRIYFVNELCHNLETHNNKVYTTPLLNTCISKQSPSNMWLYNRIIWGFFFFQRICLSFQDEWNISEFVFVCFVTSEYFRILWRRRRYFCPCSWTILHWKFCKQTVLLRLSKEE